MFPHTQGFQWQTNGSVNKYYKIEFDFSTQTSVKKQDMTEERATFFVGFDIAQ